MAIRVSLKSIVAHLGIAVFSVAFNANAEPGGAMPGMSMTPSASEMPAPSTQAFKEGEKRMMEEMSAPAYTGDADKDFVSHMIPHHRGAVDMARIELKYGKDPAIRKLAQDVINAQNDEVALMTRWQAQTAR